MTRLLALAAASQGREICGLLFGSAEQIDAFQPAENIAADDARRFEIDPAVLIAAHRNERSGGAAMIGHYHSHPSGQPEPSAVDARSISGRGRLWLILGSGEARLFRECAGGPIHGAFEAIPLIFDAPRA